MRSVAFCRSFMGKLALIVALGGSTAASAIAQVPGRPTLDHLNASVVALQRSGTSLHLTYRLTWLARPEAAHWALKSSEPVYVNFWTAKRGLVRGAASPVTIAIENDFAVRTARTATYYIAMPVPKGAKFISLALGRSGLETPPAPIP